MTATNHVFERPCPNPPALEVFRAARALTVLATDDAANTDHEVMPHILTLCYACHGDAVQAGWHHDLATGQRKKRNMGEMLMLAVSELAEGLEGHRKSRNDDKLTHRPMIEVELADFIIRCCDTLMVEPFILPDYLSAMQRSDVVMHKINVGESLFAITRLVVLAGDALAPIQPVRRFPTSAAHLLIYAILGAFQLGHGLDLDVPGAIVEKMEFNRTRSDHSVASRLAAGGKAF